jgi:hypothetical protein
MVRSEIKFLSILVICAGTAFALAGCGSDNPAAPATETDQQILYDLVTGGSGSDSTADWFDLESILTGDPPGPSPSLPFDLAPIATRRWWRDPVRPFTHVVTDTIIDDSAYVHVETTITGTLHLMAGDSPPLTEYTKPFTDIATRNAVFRRLADSTSVFRGGWKLQQISNVQVRSNPAPTVPIDSIVVTPLPGGIPKVLTDPLALQRRADVIRLGIADSVRIQVYTHGDSARAFLHTGRATNRMPRVEIQATSGDHHVFEGIWRTPPRAGIFQAAVDVVRYETLNDDDATAFPYDATAWMLIYSVGLLNP